MASVSSTSYGGFCKNCTFAARRGNALVPNETKHVQVHLKKDENQSHEEQWEIWQCPSFRFQLNLVASQLTSIAPVNLSIYYTKEQEPIKDPVNILTEPTIIRQDKSGVISIGAQPINKQKGVKTFNLCGLSTVHSTIPPQTTHIDHQNPSCITLNRTDLTHSAALLQHWTKVLEQLSPALQDVVQVVMMIDHTSTHGHQDYSPKKILMSIPKQEVSYQVPPMVFLQALPQQAQSQQPRAGRIHPQTTQSQQIYQQPPTPPATWRKKRCATPTEADILNHSPEDAFSQTSPSSSSSSRTSFPGSVILSPLYEKSSTLNQGILNLEN